MITATFTAVLWLKSVSSAWTLPLVIARNHVVGKLKDYFTGLIAKVESSDLGNNGKDKDGFFKPTRELALRHLNLLRDLHAKPLAQPMVRDSWKFIVENLPPEWLILDEDEKSELRAMLGS